MVLGVTQSDGQVDGRPVASIQVAAVDRHVAAIGLKIRESRIRVQPGKSGCGDKFIVWSAKRTRIPKSNNGARAPGVGLVQATGTP